MRRVPFSNTGFDLTRFDSIQFHSIRIDLLTVVLEIQPFSMQIIAGPLNGAAMSALTNEIFVCVALVCGSV